MLNEFSRTELLLGKNGMRKIEESRVAVFGIGGVGSYVAEALARCGVGTIDLIDDDEVCLTNLNRQIMALHSTIGQKKVSVMKKRINDINPEAIVNSYECFYEANNADDFPYKDYDYIIDAIDTVTSKLILIERATTANCPIISCMGVGNKLHPEKLAIADIGKTSMCPLAKVMRKELKARGIKKCKVLYSTEQPVKIHEINEVQEDVKPGSVRRQIPGSISFVPSVAGLMIAGEVIRKLVEIE